MWQLSNKHGLRSGPISANEAKQLGRDKTTDKKQKPETGNIQVGPLQTMMIRSLTCGVHVPTTGICLMYTAVIYTNKEDTHDTEL